MDTPQVPSGSDVLDPPTAVHNQFESPAAERPMAGRPWWKAEGSDGIVTGLSALLADQLGLDPLWLRIGFVLLGLVGGLGLVIYGGLWLALIVGADGRHSWARFAGGALLVGAVPLIVAAYDFALATGPLAVVILLGGLAMALWRPRPEAVPRRHGLRPVDSGDLNDVPDDRSQDTDAVLQPAKLRRRVEVGTPRRERRPRPARSPLGRATLGVAIVTAAVGALIDQLNGGRVHPDQWLGSAAIVCGAGLIVGTLRGHGRWLVVPAAMFVVVGFGGGLLARAGIALDNAFGDQRIAVFALSPAQQSLEVGFGSTQIDVQEVPDQQVTIDVNMASGNLDLLLYADVAVEVRTNFESVDVVYMGAPLAGPRFTFGPDRAPEVVINVSMLRGSMHVSDVTVDDVSDPPLTVDMADPPVTIDAGAPPAPDRAAEIQEMILGGTATGGTATGNTATGIAQVADGVQVTADGWLILADGEAVLDPQDGVVIGSANTLEESVTWIVTSRGNYLITGPLLITPANAVFDLPTIRRSATGIDETAPPPTITVPSTITVPPVSAELEPVSPTTSP